MALLGFKANGDQADQELQVPAFKEYGLSELRKATNGFSTDYIVSESGEKAPNVVYRGKLENNRLVAVKRFSKQSWPDAQQFVVRTFTSLLSVSLVRKIRKREKYCRKKGKKNFLVYEKVKKTGIEMWTFALGIDSD